MIEVYTDGAARGNPGPAGVGIYIKAQGEKYEYSFSLDTKLSNHEAEFIAVIKALEICREQFPDEILSFRSDSKIVVDVIEADFTKNKAFQPLLNEIREKSDPFPFFFIKWIPEKQNKHADELARKAVWDGACHRPNSVE